MTRRPVNRDKKYIEDRSIPVPFSGCWLWLGSSGKFGHGDYIGKDRKVYKAHRLAYELWKGPIPSDLWVLHSCDCGWCVNPDHLRLGTQQDNNEDRRVRGRAAKKLTREQANTIRVAAGTNRELADIFGIAPSMVSNIRTGKNWKC